MRSHTCGQVTDLLIGQEITLAGWVNRRRDHGGVIFMICLSRLKRCGMNFAFR